MIICQYNAKRTVIQNYVEVLCQTPAPLPRKPCALEETTVARQGMGQAQAQAVQLTTTCMMPR